MVDQSFDREVDEELRRERLRQIWRKYGGAIVVVAIAIVGGVAGYKGWQYWSAKRAAETGGTLMRALALAEDGKWAEAERILAKLAEDGPAGYRVLATLRLAAAKAHAGKRDEAVRDYDRLAESAGDDVLRGFARIQAATLRLGVADWTEMQNRLKPLLNAESPWRHSARELMGLAAWKAGKADEARRLFEEALGDGAAPPGLRRRAQMMLALLASKEAGKEAGRAAPGAGTSDGAAKQGKVGKAGTPGPTN